MSTLWVGASQTKYLGNHLGDPDSKYYDPLVKQRFRRGYPVEKMMSLISDIVENYEIVVLHVGANNIINGDDAEMIIEKYQSLVVDVKTKYPMAHIVISGLLPRSYDGFVYVDGKPSTPNSAEGDRANKIAEQVNRRLSIRCHNTTRYSYVGHPAFMDRFGVANRKLLSRDGLHLTPSGQQQLIEDVMDVVDVVRQKLVSASKSAPPTKATVNQPEQLTASKPHMNGTT